MTTIDEFRAELAGTAPPNGTGPALQALWWAAKGEWDQAHACVQRLEGTPDCDLVHAHLHRQEGDLANAGYWYRAAGRPVPTMPLADEWAALAAELLSPQAGQQNVTAKIS